MTRSTTLLRSLMTVIGLALVTMGLAIPTATAATARTLSGVITWSDGTPITPSLSSQTFDGVATQVSDVRVEYQFSNGFGSGLVKADGSFSQMVADGDELEISVVCIETNTETCNSNGGIEAGMSYYYTGDASAASLNAAESVKVVIDSDKSITIKLPVAKPTTTNDTKKSTTKPKTMTSSWIKSFGKKSGKAKVGKTVKVSKASFSKAGKKQKLKVAYQWYANGKAIKGAKKARKASLKIAKSLKNKKLTVKITVSKSGYKSKVKTISFGKVK